MPRETLKNLFALAESFLTYPTLHIDAVTGNAAYKKRVALTPCRELLMIEVTYRDHEPEQNQDDLRRTNLRGRRSHIISVDESQM